MDRKADSVAAGAWVMLLLSTLMQSSISFITQGFGPIVPYLEEAFALTKAQAGFVGGCVGLGVSSMIFFSGIAVDRFGEKRIMVLGGLLSGITAISISRAAGFYSLAALIILTGACTSTASPSGSKAIVGWFPYSRRGFAMGIRQGGASIGAAISAFLTPIIARSFGWKWALIAMGIFPICGALLGMLFYREPDSKTHTAGEPSRKKTDWSLLKKPSAYCIGFMGALMVAAQFICLSYLVSYYSEYAGINLERARYFLVTFQVFAFSGRVLWGWFSDTVFHGRRKPALNLICILCGVTSLLMLCVHRGIPVALLLLFAAMFGFSAGGWPGVWMTIISEDSGADRAGAAIGFCSVMSNLGPSIFSPIFGRLIDRSGTYTMSWIFLASLAVVSLLLLCGVREPIRDPAEN